MSTEHQRYSIANQGELIRAYATKRGLNIVRTYADEGKSGVSINRRLALQQLIRDVQSGVANFQTILVYDVSRWGRFQDVDESAYYEYICRRAGIEVIYCAEQFVNDGSAISTILKGIKRVMAAEYSRELSVKSFAGSCRLAELGFRQGGTAGFGLRRAIIGEAGEVRAKLEVHEHKNLLSDRVILTPGPQSEIKIVHKIYSWFTRDRLLESEIAARLNRMNVRTSLGKLWARGSVREVLANEKYIGNNVYNRTSYKLKTIHIKNPTDMWVRKDQAFNPIIDTDMFDAAKKILNARTRNYYSDEDLLDCLRRLHDERGTLSGKIINGANTLSPTGYVYRFGTLRNAFKLIGFTHTRDYRYLEENRYLRRLYPGIRKTLEVEIRERGGTIETDPGTELLRINGEITASLVLGRCRTLKSGSHRWEFRMGKIFASDITVAVRLNHTNEAALDYFIFPRLVLNRSSLLLGDSNPSELERYRSDTLETFYDMATRRRVKRVT